MGKVFSCCHNNLGMSKYRTIDIQKSNKKREQIPKLLFINTQKLELIEHCRDGCRALNIKFY